MRKLFFLFLTIGLTVPALTAQTLFWETNSKEDVLKGSSDSVRVSERGRISIAPSIETVSKIGEQYVWSTAIEDDGRILVGTGPAGKLFRVGRNGDTQLVFDSEELNISAVDVDDSGNVYAASSPDGKIYKITRGGSSSVLFDPKLKYIWSLKVVGKSLFAGTGETGRVYRIDLDTGASEVYFDTDDTHVISLDADSSGAVYAGTDSSGQVYKITSKDSAFAILDSPLREVHEIAVGSDGSVYALVLSESASTSEDTSTEKKIGPEQIKIKRPDPAMPATPPTPKESRYKTDGAKSVVYRILANGVADIIWNSKKYGAFAISKAENGVYLGTGKPGRVFHVRNDASAELLFDISEEQVSTFAERGSRKILSTSNSGQIIEFGNQNTANEGVYSSAVLDAESISRWGRLFGRSSGARFETRAGNSMIPGKGWSGWIAIDPASGAIKSPSARFLQWRTKVGGTGFVDSTTVSFRPVNIAPEVLSIEVLPPNVGLAENPKPIIDVNIETLGLDPTNFGLAVPNVPPRRVFQAGARSFQWKASDRNKDSLRYSVSISKAGEDRFETIGLTSSNDFMTLDARTLEDGEYVLKVTANDGTTDGSSISGPFIVDNTGPTVKVLDTNADGNRLTVSFEAVDASSYLTKAEYQTDGGQWISVNSLDLILDGARESFRITVPESGEGSSWRVMTLRVFDSVGNVGYARHIKK